MKKEEAIEEMKKGKKITHTLFTSEEFIFMEDGGLYDETGYRLSWIMFWGTRSAERWDDGWSIYKPDDFF